MTSLEMAGFSISILKIGKTDGEWLLGCLDSPSETIGWSANGGLVSRNITSMRSLKIPVEVIHLPIGIKVKLFPPQVTLRVTLPLSLVNAVEAVDFSLVVDYNDIIESQSSSLELRLLKQPSSVKKTIWEPKTVNYLIRK